MIPALYLERFNVSPYLVVIDIETEAQTPKATIGAIGAVMINLCSLSVATSFYAAVNLDQPGRVVDEDTLAFWRRQEQESPSAFAQMYKTTDRIPLEQALNELNAFIQEANMGKSAQVLANGPEFDNVILNDAFMQYGIKTPWRYTANQSLRTVVLLCQLLHGINPRDEIAPNQYPHHALFDATHEATAFIHGLRRLANTSPAPDVRLTELECKNKETTPA
ncbi:hypothetical protein A1OW_10355 [Enterovibrio norvegicus]|uniref:3'-5' exonuclease n=1 Tax=Enterovibrio norvegicus TaxID=188144 RepID=UPI0002D6F43E|nr:3'-5' exoribonuclease [Enterovibrio norvegicus]OEF50994.1 hypothetical protein A1OW_10355 [Enterovibrio norvegicus]